MQSVFQFKTGGASVATGVGSGTFSGFGKFSYSTSNPCYRNLFLSSAFKFPLRTDKIEGRSVAIFSPYTCSSFTYALTDLQACLTEGTGPSNRYS